MLCNVYVTALALVMGSKYQSALKLKNYRLCCLWIFSVKVLLKGCLHSKLVLHQICQFLQKRVSTQELKEAMFPPLAGKNLGLNLCRTYLAHSNTNLFNFVLFLFFLFFFNFMINSTSLHSELLDQIAQEQFEDIVFQPKRKTKKNKVKRIVSALTGDDQPLNCSFQATSLQQKIVLVSLCILSAS